MKKGIPYTCRHCDTKQVFDPATDPQSVDVMEHVEREPVKKAYWPVCPACGGRNRISPKRR